MAAGRLLKIAEMSKRWCIYVHEARAEHSPDNNRWLGEGRVRSPPAPGDSRSRRYDVTWEKLRSDYVRGYGVGPRTRDVYVKTVMEKASGRPAAACEDICYALSAWSEL